MISAKSVETESLKEEALECKTRERFNSKADILNYGLIKNKNRRSSLHKKSPYDIKKISRNKISKGRSDRMSDTGTT